MGVARVVAVLILMAGSAACGACWALLPVAEHTTIDTPRCDKVVVHHYVRQ